ncbi:MAG: hypothetical protein WCC66_13630 [Rhizobiaceae bacterium]
MNLAKVKPVLLKGAALAAMFALGGCVSSPTYGTGKSANSQLMEDVGAAFSIKPQAPTGIKYEPRPEVLKTGKGAALPEPQETVTKQAGVWPESPEQKRARLRQEATDAQGDPLFVPKIKNDQPTGNELANQIAELNRGGGGVSEDFKKRKAIAAAGSPTNRKTLSEPPLEYRAPAETSAYGDLGEDEAKKERRLRAEARKKKGKKSFRDYVPWL